MSIKMKMLMLRLFATVAALAAASALPDPFTRVLRVQDPPLTGRDVIFFQNLLQRATGCGGVAAVSGAYDAATAAAVRCFQGQQRLATDGVVGNATAWRVLAKLSRDGWKDDGRSAGELGYKYKLLLPVHANRSVETTATLLDARNNVLLRFPARAHGYDVDARGRPITGVPWPDLSDDGCPRAAARQGCVGLNAFASDGATPTGLAEIDLNSPEDVPKLYGPYPVNRFVRGKTGNAGFLVPSLRDGILVHTGEWANYSSWTPGQPMPNSAGCVHSYLPDIKAIWQLLVSKCGVVVRNNTNGKTPYPYKPQGIASVFVVDDK